jgi:hypothetical protein
VTLRRRLDGVKAISISQSRQSIVVEFNADHSFPPEEFRKAVAETGLEVLALQIEACGVVEESQGRRSFVAGASRFAMDDSADARVGERLCANGRLGDSSNPSTLVVIAARPATQ